MENLNLSSEQLDALKEIGTIGGGSAATALSQILGKRVTIAVPQVKLIASDRITASEFLIKPDDVALAVDLKILGALKGEILVLFSQKSAMDLIDIIMKRPVGATQFLNLFEASALSETAHILCGSYLNAVGELLNLHQLIPSIPQTVIDRMDRLNHLMLKKFEQEGFNYLLPIENHLKIEEIEMSLFVVFILHQESIARIHNIIGV